MNSKNYTVDIFTMGYNEEYLLPYFVNFYKSRLNECNITFVDNLSTDESKRLAQELGCTVDTIDTGDQIRDDILRDFKNNYWKKSKADWIIVVDIDEWIDIKSSNLQTGNSFFRCVGYDMVGGPESEYGVRNPMYDKISVFNKNRIKEINYHHGAHIANPTGNLRQSSFRPNLYHMRYLSRELLISRYEELKNRMSEFNNQNGFAGQYYTDPKLLIEKYNYLDKVKTKVR